MTVICYRDGVMAADTAIWSPESVLTGFAPKIVRSKYGALIGASGSTAICERFLSWAENTSPLSGFEGFDPECFEDESFEGLIACDSGEVYHLDELGRTTCAEAEFHAIGCAAKLAIGAMMAGATAMRAVRLCIQRHAFVGGDVTVIEHDVIPGTPSFVSNIDLASAPATGFPQ